MPTSALANTVSKAATTLASINVEKTKTNRL
jgi:hypothetical protein